MLYVVEGVQASSGKKVRAHVEAETLEAAVARANRHGLLVIPGTQAVLVDEKARADGGVATAASTKEDPITVRPPMAAVVTPHSTTAPNTSDTCVRISRRMMTLVILGSATVGAILVGVPLFVLKSGTAHPVVPLPPAPLVDLPSAAIDPSSEPQAPSPQPMGEDETARQDADHTDEESLIHTDSMDSGRGRADFVPGPFVTSSERDFFLALGRKVRVDGVAYDLPPRLDQLPGIAAVAAPPLKGQIEKFVEHTRRLYPTPAEEADLAERMQRGQAAMQRAMLGAMLGGDLLDIVSDVFREAGVVGAWRTQREILERGIESKLTIDGVTQDIILEVAGRGPVKRGDDAGITFTLAGQGDDLVLRGSVGSLPIEGGILVIEILPRKSQGGWTTANVLAGFGMSMIGVDALDSEAQAEGAALAAAQEATGQLSFVAISLLPEMAAGAEVEVSSRFAMAALPSIESVNVLLVTPHGVMIVEEMPGLTPLIEQVTAQRAAEAERLRAEREAARLRSPADQGRSNSTDRPARRERPVRPQRPRSPSGRNPR